MAHDPDVPVHLDNVPPGHYPDAPRHPLCAVPMDVVVQQTDSWPETLAGLCRYGVRHADDPDLVFHSQRILNYVAELPPAECRRVARDLTRELAEEQEVC